MIVVAAHAYERYRERWRPTLTMEAARDELEALLKDPPLEKRGSLRQGQRWDYPGGLRIVVCGSPGRPLSCVTVLSIGHALLKTLAAKELLDESASLSKPQAAKPMSEEEERILRDRIAAARRTRKDFAEGKPVSLRSLDNALLVLSLAGDAAESPDRT